MSRDDPSERDSETPRGARAASEGERADQAERDEPERDDEHGDDEHGDDERGDGREQGEAHRAPTPRVTTAELALAVAGPTLLTALATWIGFDARRGGEWALVGPLAVSMGAGAALSALALARWGVLAERLRPARGDVAFAALLAAVLYGLAKVGQLTLAPQGSQQELWLTRLYLLLGDPRASGRMALGLTVLAVGAAEELTWRGLTFEALLARLGPGRAIALSSLAYAAAQAPSALRLADPLAGPNPLLVAEALVLGALLAAVRVRTGRLFPAVLAHALFSWAAFEFPLWRL